MDFPKKNDDVKKALDSDSLKAISEELAKNKAFAERGGESSTGDSLLKDFTEAPEEKNEEKSSEGGLSYEWLTKYNYPETLHNLIVSLNMEEDQLLSLQIEDLKDSEEVYKKIRSMQKSKYESWEQIAKDDMLRNHALENLVNEM